MKSEVLEKPVSDIEARVRDYILENYLFTDDQSELDSADSLLERGIIDSTAVLEIIAFLEEEFRVVVADDEMVPENLDSVNNLTKFIHAKQGASVAQPAKTSVAQS